MKKRTKAKPTNEDSFLIWDPWELRPGVPTVVSIIHQLSIRHLWVPRKREDFYSNHNVKVDHNAFIVFGSF